MRTQLWIASVFIAASVAIAGLPSRAAAFCGFYVAGADSDLYANATMVVLMRDGTRTVLSMQNNYQGPPDAFALVIPVPTVLTQDQVKILPKSVFQHVDALGAPRLVEYWEDDPCRPPYPETFNSAGAMTAPAAPPSGDSAVKIEAQFTVGEYDVVILSANDSSALDGWLRSNQYNIPNGAADVLAPYVAAGTKFFVAKVDASKVTFVNGQAALSPLRFYYDTPDFTLPVRLGLLNSQGAQDLIVNILAPTRFEVANYPNVTVPTNLLVKNDVRNSFPGFYEALFSKVLDKNPGAVVTEYSWDSASCDPCPTPPLEQSDLATLGADVTRGLGADMTNAPNGVVTSYVDYTLTRLHYRYTKDSLGDDLVFKQVDAIMGGRGIPDAQGNLDTTVETVDSTNNFQGRYVILHPWTDAVTCANPLRGSWGYGSNSGAPPAIGATNAALSGMTPAPASLSSSLAQSVPALGVDLTSSATGGAGGTAPAADGGSSGAIASGAAAAAAGAAGAAGQPTRIVAPFESASQSKGCNACSVGTSRSLPPSAAGCALFLFGAFAARRRTRAKRS